MVQKLKSAANFIKSKITIDELDEKLLSATNQQNWQTSTQILHWIANETYNYEKRQRIQKFVLLKFNDKNWKRLLKNLHLSEFLLKNGSPEMVTFLKQNVYYFRNLDTYTFIEGKTDRGQAIRKQSKVIIDLLSNDSRLNEERIKAKEIRQKMAQVTGSKNYGSSYASFNNSNIGGVVTKKEGYQNYTSETFKFANFPVNNQHKEQPAHNFTKIPQKKQEKKLFQNMNLKLVKPPAKKPNPPQEVKTIQKQTPPTSQKQQNNIIDFDFGLTPSTQVKQPSPNTQLNFFDTPSTTQQKPTQKEDPNIFSTQIWPSSQTNTNNASYTTPSSFNQNTQQQSISLNQNISQSKEEKKDPFDLIDFSNFREQLKDKPAQKSNITQSWNW